MEAENDSALALEGLNSLMATFLSTTSTTADPLMPPSTSTTSNDPFSLPSMPFTFTSIHPNIMTPSQSWNAAQTQAKDGILALDGDFGHGEGGGEAPPPKVANKCPPKRGSRANARVSKKAALNWAIREDHQPHTSTSLPPSAFHVTSRIMESEVIAEVVNGSISTQFQQYILGKSPVLASSNSLFQVDSLDTITQCCLQTEELLFAYDFISMVNYISFAAKIKRYVYSRF